jgi:CHASE2 domain-containing sensor protein
MAFSKLEKAMALVIGIDIAAPGFSRAAAKATVAALGRSAAFVAPRAAAAVPAVAGFSPVATGAALGLGALATPPGQQLLEMAGERGRMDRIRFEQALTDLTQTKIPKARAKTKSKFNKAVSAGMKAVKASTSYGKKGTITNAKKAFTAVTKTASKINKGGKVAKSGITRKIGLAIKRIL